MSDTPRTDAHVWVHSLAGGNHEAVFASVARELERELAEAKRRLSEGVRALTEIRDNPSIGDDAEDKSLTPGAIADAALRAIEGVERAQALTALDEFTSNLLDAQEKCCGPVCLNSPCHSQGTEIK